MSVCEGGMYTIIAQNYIFNTPNNIQLAPKTTYTLLKLLNYAINNTLYTTSILIGLTYLFPV